MTRHIVIRPSLEVIRDAAAEAFGEDASQWVEGKRSSGAGRAVAAHLAHRVFGYGSREVADLLGHKSHSAVGKAMMKVEATPKWVSQSKKIEKELRGETKEKK